MSSVDSSILDWVFRALANSRRRMVLGYLLDRNVREVTFDELVDTIVDAESRSASPDREEIAVALHHKHLPVLAEKGLIEYDRDRDVVRREDRCAQIEPYLSLVPDLGQSFVDE